MIHHSIELQGHHPCVGVFAPMSIPLCEGYVSRLQHLTALRGESSLKYPRVSSKRFKESSQTKTPATTSPESLTINH